MRIKAFSYPQVPPSDCQVCGQPRTLNHDCSLVASYQDVGNNWRGVIRERDSREIIAVVLGSYRNRDQGCSAVNAARQILSQMQTGGRIA